MSAQKLSQRLLHVRVPRPKIAGLGPEELFDYVTTLLAEREPIYMQSKIVVDCNDSQVGTVAGRLRYLLK